VSLLTDELRAKIGTTVTYTAPEPFGAAAGRYYAIAMDDDNPLYTDRDSAAELGMPDVSLPPTLLFETNQHTGLPVTEDGFAGHSWGLEVPGTRQVRGGNRYTFHRRVLPSDVLTVRYSLADITPKTTRSGAEMLVFTTKVDYVDQHGELVAENEETLVLVALEMAE
jgi:acyl dehydratase